MRYVKEEVVKECYHKCNIYCNNIVQCTYNNYKPIKNKEMKEIEDKDHFIFYLIY